MSVENTKFYKLTTPIFIQMVLLVVIFLTDTVFLSRVSDAAVAGVGGMMPLLLSGIALMHAFSDSGTSLLGQALGAGQPRRVSAVFAVMLLIGLLVGCSLSLSFYGLSGRLGNWMGFSPDVAEASRQYVLYIAPLFLMDAFFINLNSLLFAHGETRWNMYAAIGSAVTNFVCNIGLMYEWVPGWRLGPAEVAMATLAAQIPPILIMAYAVFVRLGVRLRLNTISRTDAVWGLKRLLRIGLPATVEPVSQNASQLVMMSMLAITGTAAVAAFAYGKNLFVLLSYAGGISIGIGTQIVVSHYQGKGAFAQADSRLKTSLKQFIPFAILVVILVNLGAHWILGLLTHDPEIIRMGQLVLLYLLIIEPMRAANFIIYPSLRGSGDVNVPVAASIVAHWGFGVGLAWYLAMHLGWGMAGVLAGIAADELVRAMVNLQRWHAGHWQAYCTPATAASPSA
ncbi:MATE family efflux transporter [Pseudoduganella buxea]|uniref:MATE family efflux transporter n=1 Tax=Pseudoduganella buxea TaxID=1949069 RepID=A0A6I3T2I1_9BURK|nr:MATE family efflux transporter [Pseudoduganella buxea]MTV55753.1 MATE family efflux transporter [Pseudoduganella buxea]GGC24957.1 MATE family efflux transporter [Pseudoduganella buxea]